VFWFFYKHTNPFHLTYKNKGYTPHAEFFGL